jgi:hypothetical protein
LHRDRKSFFRKDLGDAGYWGYGDTHKTPWPTAQSVIADYATGFLKGPSDNTFTLKAGDAAKGKLTTMWDGSRPSPGYSPKTLQGAIIIGTGGDGSNYGTGTFLEGAMTKGNPPDSIDDKIQAEYGSLTTTITRNGPANRSSSSIRYDPSTGAAVVGCALDDAHHVRMDVVDLQGRVVAKLLDATVSADPHVAVWDARQAHADVYALTIEIDGSVGRSGTIIVGR